MHLKAAGIVGSTTATLSSDEAEEDVWSHLIKEMVSHMTAPLWSGGHRVSNVP